MINNVAMITGASGGVAQAVARQLAKSGWQLALVSRDLSNISGNTGAASACLIEAAWITGQVLPVDGGFTAVRPLQRAV